MKLISITKSDRANKKYKALFEDSQHSIYSVYFGAAGYTDYTMNHDDEKKRLYLLRHRKNENWNDPISAGALSRWILWNKPTLKESISDFKKRFNL
jgi:hypothetical protein